MPVTQNQIDPSLPQAPAPRTQDLAQALLTLTRELWVVTDRLYVLEQVLDARGLDVSGEIARFEPDAAQSAELAAARERLLEQLISALKGS